MTAVDGLQCNLSISLHSWTLLQYFRLLLHYTSTPLLWYCIFKLLYLQNYLITSVTSYFECCISVFAHMSPSLLLLVKFCHFFSLPLSHLLSPKISNFFLSLILASPFWRFLPKFVESSDAFLKPSLHRKVYFHTFILLYSIHSAIFSQSKYCACIFTCIF